MLQLGTGGQAAGRAPKLAGGSWEDWGSCTVRGEVDEQVDGATHTMLEVGEGLPPYPTHQVPALGNSRACEKFKR